MVYLTGMGIKGFFTRKILERQLKQLPEAQRSLFIKMFEENPDLFEKIAKEVREKKKQGQDETLATVAVMEKYRSEIQSIVGSVQKKM